MSLSELRPTSRGIVALGTLVMVVVAAVVTGTPELAPLAVALGVPLVVGPVLALRRSSFALASVAFHAHVEPGAVEAGSTMEVRLSVTNRSSTGTKFPQLSLPDIGGRWRPTGGDPGPATKPLWVAPSVPSLRALPHPGPGRTESCLLEVPTGRRGVFTLPPQQTWSHDPFGLVGAPGPRTPVVVAVIHPVPYRPGGLVIGSPTPTVGSTSTLTVDSGSGDGMGELQGIRPYVAGDRLSLLHWPAKVRYGTWFVRQFDAEGTGSVSVVIDDRAGVHRRVEFERLVSAALWAVLETTRSTRAVHLVTLSGRSYSFAPSEQGRAEARLVLAD
ncbi:MAG TPA: DUF58 domain-containing protein, partial [Acidimicrobiales bacterium]